MSRQFLASHIQDDAHPSDIFASAVTSKYVLTGSGDVALKVWDINSDAHERVHSFHYHKLGIHHIATDAEGKLAASAGFDGQVMLYDMQELEEIGTIGNDQSTMAGEAWAIAFSPDGKKLAATTYDGRVNVWDTQTRSRTAAFQTKGVFGVTLDWSSDGKYVASGHANGGLYIFSMAKGKLLHSLSGHNRTIRSVKFSPGSSLLAAAGDSTVLTLYDLKAGEQVGEMKSHTKWIFSVGWNASGELLATGSFDGKVKIWSLERKECVSTQSESDGALWNVSWLRAGQRNEFVTTGADGALRFYREAG